MKNPNSIFLLIVLAIVLVACKKKDDPEFLLPANTPVFYSIGQINGSAIILQAGVSGYTQTNNYSHNGAYYQFKSLLASDKCSSCPGNLQIAFNDSTPIPNGQPSAILNHLKAGKNIQYALGSNPIANMGKAIITWTNSSGIMFTSERKKQPSSSYLNILEVGPYTDMANGGKLLTRVKAEINCRVYTPSNDSLDITNLVTVFSIDRH